MLALSLPYHHTGVCCHAVHRGQGLLGRCCKLVRASFQRTLGFASSHTTPTRNHDDDNNIALSHSTTPFLVVHSCTISSHKPSSPVRHHGPVLLPPPSSKRRSKRSVEPTVEHTAGVPDLNPGLRRLVCQASSSLRQHLAVRIFATSAHHHRRRAPLVGVTARLSRQSHAASWPRPGRRSRRTARGGGQW